MDGLHRVYVGVAQRNDPLMGVLRISAETVPREHRAFPSDGSVFAFVLLSFHAKEARKGHCFDRSPVLTTARAGALKSRNLRSQGESIEIAKTRKTLHEANR